jgi:enamine deaminase RidA (YjgF/YER057c/UK114 family)
MPRDVIYTDQLMRPIAHFSHASRVEDLIHVGASAGVFPDLRLAGDDRGRTDMEAQTRRMFANLRTTLDLLGGRMSDVVRIKAYVADPRDIPKYLAIYAEAFPDLRPAHSVVGSWGFPLPQAAVEIDTTAIVDGRPPARLERAAEKPPGTPGGAVAAGRFHHAAVLPVDEDGRPVAEDVRQQVETVLEKLRAMLSEAAFGIADLCNLHVTIADIRDYALVQDGFARFFGKNFPSWTVVAAPLARPDVLIGLESVASRAGAIPVSSELSPLVDGQPAPAMMAGDMLFLSGQLALDDAGATVEQQTRSIWRKLHALIEAAGFPEDSLLRTNNVLTDWRDYAGFNRGYGANVPAPYVPRATVLGTLSDRRARVQTEGIAHRRGPSAKIVQVAPLVDQASAGRTP